MKNSRKLLILLALSLAVTAGIVRADSPVLSARAAAAKVVQTPSAQAQVGLQSQTVQPEAAEPSGADNDAVEQGDQTGPETGVEDNAGGPDTDNIQQGDQSGPEDTNEGPEDPAK